jgi:hypothetical protein
MTTFDGFPSSTQRVRAAPAHVGRGGQSCRFHALVFVIEVVDLAEGA